MGAIGIIGKGSLIMTAIGNFEIIIIIIIIIIFIIIIIIIIKIELTHSKTMLEITVEIEPQQAALDFKNFSQNSSLSK